MSLVKVTPATPSAAACRCLAVMESADCPPHLEKVILWTPQFRIQTLKFGAPMQLDFEWNDSLRLGDAVLDEQHRRILELANAISDHDDRTVVQHAIMELFRHTREHFGVEEDLMRKLGYPRLEEHRKQHEALIEDLGHVAARKFEDSASIKEFKAFVHRWIVEHLLEHDRKLIDFARQTRAPYLQHL